MEIKKIGVLGAGTMGAGIAQVCLQAGYKVILIDIGPEILERAMKGLDKAWSKAVEKGKITHEAVAGFKTILTTSTDVNDFKDVDMVIEAIVENIDIKKKVHKQLAEICKPEAILASNTSALSITEIAAATDRPDKVLGMHFFNPVAMMKLVEVIPGIETSAETAQIVLEVTRKIGKEPVLAKESPGFIACI